MSDPVMIALITSAGPTLASIIGLWLNYRKIEQVHLATNSMNDELVKTTAKAAHAAGVKQEADRKSRKESR